MHNRNTPVLLDVVGKNTAKFAERFAIAQHDLTAQQLKAWIVFVATLNTDNDDGSNIYQFSAVELAKRLAIDERKARGVMVSKVFEQLSKKQITYYSDPDENGEQHRFTANLVSAVVYNKNNKLLQLEIPSVIRPLLFALKQGTFMKLDINDIVTLDSATTIRVYIYLQDLSRKGVYCIGIDEFRQSINIPPSVYSAFKEFKRSVIKPSIREIRKHTKYKDFFIEDNGRPGVKATLIRFGFEKTVDSDIFEGVNPASAAICRKFPQQVQIVLRLAIDQGFNPRYIEDKLDDIPVERIIANFRYVLNEIIPKDKKANKIKGPDVYGKYFLTAVKEGWAEKNGRKEDMLIRDKASEKNREIQEQMKVAQENEDTANEAIYRKDMAKRYLEKMRKDFSAFDNFIRKNITVLRGMTTSGEFDIGRAMSGKKTYKEYKALLTLVESKIMLNEIKIPRQESLFG